MLLEPARTRRLLIAIGLVVSAALTIHQMTMGAHDASDRRARGDAAATMPSSIVGMAICASFLAVAAIIGSPEGTSHRRAVITIPSPLRIEVPSIIVATGRHPPDDGTVLRR